MKPTLECLEIVENRLCLDGDPPPSTHDELVPRSQITVVRQRDLRPARETGMDIRPKAIEQSLLAGVADRIACRIGSQDEIQPDCRTPGADVLNGDVIGRTTFKSEQLLVGRARGRGNDAQAQAGTNAGRSRFATERLEGFVSSTSATIGRPLPRAHAAIMTRADLLRLI
jgi:hypothetical protein